MSNLKTRIEKLEDIHHIKTPITWKEFVMGAEVDDTDMALLLGGDNLLSRVQEWSDTFTDEEIEMLLSGGATPELRKKIDNAPDELKPIIDEVAKVIKEMRTK